MSDIHVAACCDERYIAYAAVMMLSAIKANPETQLRFHLINCDISDESILKLKALISQHAGSLSVYCPDETLYGGLPTHRYGKAVYHRINLPDYLPNEVEKVIYIDSDTLVLGNLTPLWQTDLQGQPVAAVENLSPKGCEDNNMERREYFNSGVLLMDLKKWRTENLHGQVNEYARQHAHNLQFIDQSSLSAVFQSRWVRLDIAWNQQSDIYKVESKYYEGSSYSRADMRRAILQPNIVHFTGVKKPWKVYCFHPFKKQYRAILSETPWASQPPPDDSFSTRLKSLMAFRQHWKCWKRRQEISHQQKEQSHNAV